MGLEILRAPAYWQSLLAGTGPAPAQYRIGIIRTGFWLSQHFRLNLGRSLAILDLAGALLAAFALYRVLECSAFFRRGTETVKCLASAAFVSLFFYYTEWSGWYQKPETLPTAGLMALLFWAWTPSEEIRKSTVNQVGRATLILVVTLLQAFIRADVAAAAAGGVFLIALTSGRNGFSLSRAGALVTSALAIVCSAGVQLYLMRVQFPYASYGDVPVFMLPYDYRMLNLWATFFIFITPFLWTVRELFCTRFCVDGPGLAFVTGTAAYCLLFLCVGRIDEVRILLPLTLCVIPLTVRLLLQRMNAQMKPDISTV